MKKFQLNVSVTRTQGIDAVVTTNGDFNKEEVMEAIGVVKEAVLTETEDGVSYSGSARVFDDETDADLLNISVSKADKATILDIVSYMNDEPTPTETETPVESSTETETPVETPTETPVETTEEQVNAPEGDEQQP